MRMFRSLLSGVLILLGVTPVAFGWGSATHAHIADGLGRTGTSLNQNELYSAMVADLFTTAYSLPYVTNLYAVTHFPPECLAPWVTARSRMEHAIGFGFASHNGAWGADYTAHSSGLTFGIGEGYVIAKAKALLAAKPLPPELGIPDGVALELAHSVVEIAVDIMVKRLDTSIGWKLYLAASRRSGRTPKLLARAYGPSIAPDTGSVADAQELVINTEREFRETMREYGYALMQDEATAARLFASALVGQAGAYLAAQGLPVPPPAQLELLIIEYLDAAKDLCVTDYAGEIAATIEFVADQLREHGIEY